MSLVNEHSETPNGGQNPTPEYCSTITQFKISEHVITIIIQTT
jgi:hypothetical protein